MLDGWARNRHARRLYERAIRYAANGWPVAALAVPRHGACPCDLGDCVEPHVVGPPIRNGFVAAGVWKAYPWDIALVTADFEVMDLPPAYGAPLDRRLDATCPIAMAPARRRWWFFLEPGSIAPERVAAVGGTLHSGPDDWVPAPGTRVEGVGRIRWLVHPITTDWRPHRRSDAIDSLLV